MNPGGHNPARRLRVLETVYNPPRSCEAGHGQRFRIIYNDAPEPVPQVCPTCGRPYRVIRLIDDERGPQ